MNTNGIRRTANKMKNFARTVEKVKSTAREGALIIDPMAILGKRNSDHINLSVKNTDLALSAFLVLGTPVGVPAEQSYHPQMLAAIGRVANSGTVAQSITDNVGVGALAISGINSRVVRNGLFLEDIEVITSSDAQRGKALKVLEVPANYMSDSYMRNGKYEPVYSEFTGMSIGGEGVMLSEYTGVVYEILPNTTVELNLVIGAMDIDVYRALPK